jgi:hypothetical protein
MMGMASNARADVQFMVTGPGGFSMTSAVMPGANGSFTVLIPGFGNVDVNSVTSNSPGGPSSSTMDLTYRVNGTALAGGTFVITVSSNNFTFPGLGSANGFFNNGGNGDPGTSETIQTWVNNNNSLLTLTAPFAFNSGPITSFTTGDVPFTATLGANPYSITERVTVVLPADTLASGDFITRVTPGAVIPEPASLALLLVGGLPVVGVVSRRLRKQQA